MIIETKTYEVNKYFFKDFNDLSIESFVEHFLQKKFEKPIISEEPYETQPKNVYKMVGTEFNTLVFDQSYTNVVLIHDDTVT